MILRIEALPCKDCRYFGDNRYEIINKNGSIVLGYGRVLGFFGEYESKPGILDNFGIKGQYNKICLGFDCD